MTIKEQYQEALDKLYDGYHYGMAGRHYKDVLQELIDQHIDLRQLIETGDIFSPQEFYDEYESCLKGDGIAVFIMKDLSVSSDFKTCWNILENCVDKYDIFDKYECRIAFVIWFNR